MSEVLDPLLVGQRVVAILETGQRDATYKLATLMALVDHCIENLPECPEDVLRVPCLVGASGSACVPIW